MHAKRIDALLGDGQHERGRTPSNAEHALGGRKRHRHREDRSRSTPPGARSASRRSTATPPCSLSAAPIVSAKGDATFRQAYASAFISGGDVSISQGGARSSSAARITIDTGGGVAVVASEATVRRGWIGLLFARHADVSEDSASSWTREARSSWQPCCSAGSASSPIALYLSAKTRLRVAPRVAGLDASRRLRLRLRCFRRPARSPGSSARTAGPRPGTG